MKIIDDRAKEQHYSDLNCGDCFECDGICFIKTNIKSAYEKGDYVAIALKDGNKVDIAPEFSVKQIKTELHIINRQEE